MTAHRRRRIAALATTLAAVTPTAGLLAGCEGADNALDCLGDADTISDSLKAIREAGGDAVKHPSRADDSVDTIERNLDRIDDEIDDTADDGEVDRAVDDLAEAIEDHNEDILDGKDPDSDRIDAAADRLREVCTS